MMKNDNFRYSVHDEPTDDWTIEELLKWCLLQSQLKTTTKRDEIINTFQGLFDIGKQEILELQSQVVRIQKEQQEKDGQQQQHDDVDVNEKVEEQQITIGKQQQQQGREEDNSATSNNENENPNEESANNSNMSNSKSKSNSKSNETKNPTKIQIQIIQGPYEGTTHTLQPTYKKPCWVGRSTSKKFRDRGISLNKDDEVSTTHGKFHVTNSNTSSSNSSARSTEMKFMFTDTGSTNGTVYNGEEIEDNIPLELVDDMVIVIGNSHFLIHLI